MAIFNSYVKLPEGSLPEAKPSINRLQGTEFCRHGPWQGVSSERWTAAAVPGV